MSSLKEIIDRLQGWWTQLHTSSRVGIILAALAVAAAVGGVGAWSSRPQYTTLVNQLSPGEAAELVSKLDAEGIHHKLNFSASAILVPKNQYNRARILVSDLVSVGTGAAEWDDSLLGDPGLNQYKMLRHREQSLAASIRRMKGIADAKVHLAQPEHTPFIQDQRPATASVVLDFQPGAVPSREAAAAIVALVAGSVEGLDPDSVSILDSRGRMLSSSGAGMDADISGQFEFRRRLETDLATKAEMMLARMLGERRSIVRVSADIDFTRTERQQTTFDPDSKVPIMEEVKTSNVTTTGAAIGGAAGIRPLGGRGGGADVPVPQNNKTEDSKTDYEVGKSINTVTELPGRIRRLTIAVMADLSQEPAVTDEQQDATPTESQVGRDEIEAIVKQATGFDEQRGDEIEVLVTALAGFETEDNEFIQGQKWELYNKIIRSSSLGLASLVALTLGLLTIYRLRPITIPVATRRSGNRDQAMSEFSDRVKENPEIVKAVMSAWLADSGADDEEPRRAA